LILTHQVEIEYKKNRQKVIYGTIQQMKNDTGIFNIPSILSDSQPAKQLKSKIKKNGRR
jgi:hypothetical protein